MDAMADKRGEVGARVLSFGRKRLTGMGLRLGRWMPGDAPMSPSFLQNPPLIQHPGAPLDRYPLQAHPALQDLAEEMLSAFAILNGTLAIF